VARGRTRGASGRGRAAPVLPQWPLDPPPVATVPTAAHGPVATPTAPGATRPTVRTFFCRHCRRGVDAADPPHGWLRLQRHDAHQQAHDGRSYLTVGLFCGVPCLRAWATSDPSVTP
jgi:hypothetical protein